jgi:hypothetical protein
MTASGIKGRNKTLNRARFISTCAFLIPVHNTLANSRVLRNEYKGKHFGI